jgi:hypothetical protein
LVGGESSTRSFFVDGNGLLLDRLLLRHLTLHATTPRTCNVPL